MQYFPSNFRSALYRGLRPNVTTMGVSNFVYFYVASGLRNLVPDGLETTQTDLIINALAGKFFVLLLKLLRSHSMVSQIVN